VAGLEPVNQTAYAAYLYVISSSAEVAGSPPPTPLDPWLAGGLGFAMGVLVAVGTFLLVRKRRAARATKEAFFSKTGSPPTGR
jgi:hypothetical protein